MRTKLRHAIGGGALALAFGLAFAQPSGSDELRNVNKGEPVPGFRLPTIDAKVIDAKDLKGSVVVMVFLSAEQSRSELAAIESAETVQAIADEGVRLVHITSDIIHKDQFERFRTENHIEAPLAFDADRALTSELGLIVLPATVIVDREGNLAHVILLHRAAYAHSLDAYIRHTLGTLTDGQLEERLAAPAQRGSPKSRASAHRSLARSMREKGQLDAAKDELRKALELDPADHEIVLDLCDVDLALGELDEAEMLVDQVLGVQAYHRRAQQLKGIIFFKRGRLDEAERILTEALELNPSPERAHYYLGQICESRGDSAGALKHYRTALGRLLGER